MASQARKLLEAFEGGGMGGGMISYDISVSFIGLPPRIWLVHKPEPLFHLCVHSWNHVNKLEPPETNMFSLVSRFIPT